MDGSILGQWSLCDAEVWIAPFSQRLVAGQLLLVCCMICAAALSKSEPAA